MAQAWRRGRAASGARPPLQPRGALAPLALLASLGAASAPDPADARTLSMIDRGLPDAITGELPRELPCEEPVRRARVEFPRHLLLGPADDSTVMYSGYVNVTREDYLFYWFAEAQPGAPLDAPIIVWSNGGPGCSAMEGVTTEHGPLILYGFRKQLVGRLSKNPYSWNRHAHVLYVDQPRYVGFSTGTGPFTRSSREAGLDMVQFLRGWRGLFPEHASRGVVLAAESYGGHYAPAWSAAILDHNRHASDPIRLDGIALGNGAVDEKVQEGTFAEFVQREGLVPEGLPNHHLDLAAPTWGELMGHVTSNLGYVPNYYDYRVMEEECCGCSSYNYKAWSDWLLRDDVTKALNVCGRAGVKSFADCNAGCIEIPGFDKNDSFNAREALGEALRAGIKVTLYYGTTDTVCNYVGGALLAHSLEWPGSDKFAAEPLRDLVLNGAPSGKTKAHGGLTWIQVEGAGHMVPVDNPAAAFHAIRTLLPDSSDGCEGSILDVSNFIRESERVGVGEAAGRPRPARAVVAVLAACAACAAGLLLIGGRALAAAYRGRGRHCGGLESPRLRSSPLGDRSPVHSRTPISMRSPEYVLAPTASSGLPGQLADQGRSLPGWLDA
mmetsp:Transcript_60822/g.169699  ORF Transcript_60822/g.169699 Transcript_60822/m.169699 type:complete len:610 (+) Transcript_60822:63-1892(+)